MRSSAAVEGIVLSRTAAGARQRLHRWRLAHATPIAPLPAPPPGVAASAPAATQAPRSSPAVATAAPATAAQTPTQPAQGGRVWGAVEQFHAPGVLRGWARSSHSSDPLHVSALRDGIEIGSGTTDVHRPDIGGLNGFSIECRHTVTPGDLAGGRVSVTAAAADGTQGALRVVGSILSAAVFDVMKSVTSTLGDDEFDSLLKALADSPVLARRRAELDALIRSGGSMTPEALPVLAALAALPPNPSRTGPHAEVSAVGVPTGHMARDGSALIGHEGYAFLVAGGNNLLGQYALDPDSPTVREKVAAWTALVAARLAHCTAAGPGFVQVLIPEKLTVMPDLMPYQVRVPSPIWRGVEERLHADPGLAPHFVSALPILMRLAPLGEAFPRMDTHLAARAAYEVFLAICAAMGAGPPLPDVPFTEQQVVQGDLARRFFPGVALPEVYMLPDARAMADWPKPDLVERVEPGRHMGTRYVWHTPAAPIRARVVAFGNSFFERGGSARSLSWWFARAFSEFHFVWESEMSHDYIAKVAPDWVICQGIERFMPQVPRR